MAVELQVDDISEMLIATQPYVQRDQPVFLANDLQEYHAVDRLIRDDRMKEEPGTGTSVQFPVILETSTRATGVTLTTPIEAQFGHTSDMADIPWRHSKSNYSYIRQLLAMNSSSPEKVYDYMKSLRAEGWMDLYKYLERTFWDFTPSTNELDAWGIFNWIVYNATVGFNGGVPGAYTDVAGISHDKWKNYSGQYTNVSEDDLMDKLWDMKLRTGFKTPDEISADYPEEMDRRQYYVDRATWKACKTLAENRNENLGFELGPGTNKPTYGGNQLTWIPQFDGEFDTAGTIASGSAPFLQVDWSAFGYVFLKGEFLRESQPIMLPDRDNCHVVTISLTHNTYCNNRRKQGLLAKSDPMA